MHPAQAVDGLTFDGTTLTTIHGPRYRMLVIGASQLSKYLAQIAVGLGYQVTICDPRDEYTETWDIPGRRAGAHDAGRHGARRCASTNAARSSR